MRLETFKKHFARANNLEGSQFIDRITTEGPKEDLLGNVEGIDYYMHLTEEEREYLSRIKKA